MVNIPNVEGRGRKKYDFESMELYEYFEFEPSRAKANSIRSTAKERGFKVAIRTINGKMRAYRVM